LTLVEFGAGTGQLAFDILSTMRDEHPSSFDRITYVIVETSPRMIQSQSMKLAAFAGRVQWCELSELEQTPITGIAFSNEFVDALPVHRVRMKGSAIEEQYVTLSFEKEEELLELSWGSASTTQLADYALRMGARIVEGQEIEMNLDANDWLARMSGAISRGFLVTIDYGDTVHRLWSHHRTRGTLRSFYEHRATDSPLDRIGQQDITASVNFTALIEYGRDFGFELISFERQTAFLIRMGLIERIADKYGLVDSLDNLNERLAVKNLFVPGGISDSFQVLVQRR
jgi:SAM-dependent MidA family methyltransferase